MLPSPLPELDRDGINTTVRFLGRDVPLPVLLVAANLESDLSALASLAQRYRVPFDLGDLSTIDAGTERLAAIRLARQAAPDTLLLGEIPATALLPGPDASPLSPEALREALTEIGLDGLIVRLDFADVAISTTHEPNASGALEAITTLMRTLQLPVLVRSAVGIPRQQARTLVSRGVTGLIVAGSESFDGRGRDARSVAAAASTGPLPVFAHWGIPTLAAVRMLRAVGAALVSDGQIMTGVDAAKAITLGADLVALRQPTGDGGTDPADATRVLDQWLSDFTRTLRTAMFLTGAVSLASLKQVPFIATGETREWLEAAESLWKTDAVP